MVVASGKGGVGKSVLAVNLGIFLARRKRRVILLDADFGLANTDILLNVTPLGDVSDLLDDTRPVDELLVTGPEGLRLLCGVSGLTRRGRPLRDDPRACSRALRRLRAACDVLLVDCGAGVSRSTLACARWADRLLLVTTPEPTALADAYATLKLLCLQGMTAGVGVIVNMARSQEEAREAVGRLKRVAARFLGLTLEDLGAVMWDRHVPQAVQERRPVGLRYPRCVATYCLERVCRRAFPGGRRWFGTGGAWARVASLFL